MLSIHNLMKEVKKPGYANQAFSLWRSVNE